MSKLVDAFLRHRRVTEQFVNLMPEEHFGFAAFEGGLTFGQLAVHLMNSGDNLLTSATGGTFTPPDKESLPKEPADIKRYVTERTNAQIALIEGLGDDTERKVTFRGNEMTAGDLLARQREHEAHHKGQMMMMLRMCGMKDQLFYTLR